MATFELDRSAGATNDNTMTPGRGNKDRVARMEEYTPFRRYPVARRKLHPPCWCDHGPSRFMLSPVFFFLVYEHQGKKGNVPRVRWRGDAATRSFHGVRKDAATLSFPCSGQRGHTRVDARPVGDIRTDTEASVFNPWLADPSGKC
ncbi:uncharacterized protein LOC143356377 [Halictus rubicundus]|uniref:uncharacterized protein LOC143356377 n=1 Tax=Halictus rubicundus TaxID=77578 RepID=UPI00403756DF